MPTTLADAAIAWYAHAARDLPWRRPGTSPWAVLVSEVMLQQTPVSRVLPAYEEWLRRWPRPADLAAGPAGAAIEAWGRLGYPRRALRLHQCAAAIVARHDGEVPADLDALLALPGVGEYTARAVAAFAFGRRHPVVDTNVRRLVARATAGRSAAGPATTAADLIAVEALLPRTPARAARASVAFMELGALICTARDPACAGCPLRRTCAWHAAGQPAAAPTNRRSPGYAGTDRYVRGLILALSRATPTGVAAAAIVKIWPDPVQRDRALAGLVEDGLIVVTNAGLYGLPGIATAS